MNASQDLNRYAYFSGAHSSSSEDGDPLGIQASAPVADMTGSGAHEEPTESSTEDLSALDSAYNARAEKANEKRDREDGTFSSSPRKRKTAGGSTSNAPKRTKQAAAKASSSNIRSSSNIQTTADSTVPFEQCDEAVKQQRNEAVEHIKAVWGSEVTLWPVFAFSPTHSAEIQNGAQKNPEVVRKDNPRDWSLALLDEIVRLAQTTAEAQCRWVKEVLEYYIRQRNSGIEGSMCPQDIQRTYNHLVQERPGTVRPERSPTLAAGPPVVDTDNLNNPIQPHRSTETPNTPVMADKSADLSQRAQDEDSSSRASKGSIVMKNVIEHSVYETEEFCEQCIEAMRGILEMKRQQKAKLLEEAQRLCGGFPPR